MTIEKTIDELMDFVNKFIITVYQLTFKSASIIKEPYLEVTKGMIGPNVFYIINCLIYLIVDISALKQRYSVANESFKRITANIGFEFLHFSTVDNILLVTLTFIATKLIIKITTNLMRLNGMDKTRLQSLLMYYSGLSICFYQLLLLCGLFFYYNLPSLHFTSKVFITLSWVNYYAYWILQYTVVPIIYLIAIIRLTYRKKVFLKYLFSLILIVFAVDIACRTRVFLLKYLYQTDEKSLNSGLMNHNTMVK